MTAKPRGTGPAAAPRGAGKPVGMPTRGTTNPHRLRRVDSWLCYAHELRGWPIRAEPRRWRHGELTVAWSAVAPGAHRVSARSERSEPRSRERKVGRVSA